MCGAAWCGSGRVGAACSFNYCQKDELGGEKAGCLESFEFCVLWWSSAEDVSCLLLLAFGFVGLGSGVCASVLELPVALCEQF